MIKIGSRYGRWTVATWVARIGDRDLWRCECKSADGKSSLETIMDEATLLTMAPDRRPSTKT